jgi:hypothetical protein
VPKKSGTFDIIRAWGVLFGEVNINRNMKGKRKNKGFTTSDWWGAYHRCWLWLKSHQSWLLSLFLQNPLQVCRWLSESTSYGVRCNCMSWSLAGYNQHVTTCTTSSISCATSNTHIMPCIISWTNPLLSRTHLHAKQSPSSSPSNHWQQVQGYHRCDSRGQQ